MKKIMEKIVKDVLTGKKRNRIRILNCPHCKSVMVPDKEEYFKYHCFECDVDWEIKLRNKGLK